MLSIGLISYILAVPIFSNRIPATVFSRLTSIVLMFSAVLTWNSLYYYPLSNGGISLFSGLFHVNIITLGFQLLLLVIGSLLLFGWGPVTKTILPAANSSIERSVKINSNFITTNTIGEYSLIVFFSILGGCLLISSYNFVSMYMAIELQSFAAYILCTLYRHSQSATSAGLKYFLLGSLASGIIVLGTAVIYAGTGITNYEDLAALISVGNFDQTDYNYVTTCVAGGILLIGIGYIFKVGAAPLYNWSPDVYDGVPTIITSWVSTVPKIGIFVFLLNLSFIATGYDLSWSESVSLSNLYTIYAQPFQTLLLVSSTLSLIIGGIVGLSQVRIKRLLTFSTINHIGFLLLALAVSTEGSIEAFAFYLIQYTMTNVNTFMTLLAFGYASKGILTSGKNTNVREFGLLDDLKGQFYQNPLLAISFGISLFSMAGIPPLIGFFAKQMVLTSVSYNYSYIAIIAILTSVISASYYLKIVQLMFFNKTSDEKYVPAVMKEGESANTDTPTITTMHSTVIAVITMIISLYLFDPSILLNACHLLSLSLFTV
uniref:NADH-ubiquinone oxidoreductase chain 2 n=1 Tax=Malassezia furfur TaxID=55194 RepID=A0A2I6QC43_MALFU|nr:NADH dehydrogenase subunit 2 [Malassezia furfur]AUN27927.1 NADH dehydrogenase subunit 2 [Malassezia furfur]AUN27951.1 NADH dehydrogenase subunit 2 [Malassezia furfur]AUN28018.1 NADH dehydrogenase subunit 2 [Malassezia furfur]UBU96481.1 NADH dehydrogenase subunit 2 [Malassezia furfur]UBU96564.1 NADH dehydrogenase subunit 2 [Malassezia furfur]